FRSTVPIIPDDSVGTIMLMVLVMTTGTTIIMWLGELITERGVGNGMSLLIFSSIAAGFPAALSSIAGSNNGAQKLAVALVVILAVFAVVVFVDRKSTRLN